MESNQQPNRYEQSALTGELRPQTLYIIAYYYLLGYNMKREIMKKINIRRIYYLIRHKYLTLNSVVILVAFMISAGWVWGSLGVMQRNYYLQKELDDKSRQLMVTQLDTDNSKLEQRYYHTDEYKELAVRERLGLGAIGESVLILPPNSQAVKDADKVTSTASTTLTTSISNFEQWVNFLFGRNSKSISG